VEDIRILNSRVERLNTSDLLKSENPGEIKRSENTGKYAEIWRDIEIHLGREKGENVINFIRTMKIFGKIKD